MISIKIKLFFFLFQETTNYLKKKDSTYQAIKLGNNNLKTEQSPNVNLKSKHIEDHEDTNLKLKISVLHCPSKNQKKNKKKSNDNQQEGQSCSCKAKNKKDLTAKKSNQLND